MTVLMLGFYVTPVCFCLNAFFCIFYVCVDDMLYDFKLVICAIQDSSQKKGRFGLSLCRLEVKCTGTMGFL